MHQDAFGRGARVLVVDDLLATGGTAAAACQLVETLHAEVTGVCVAIELGFLEGRTRLPNRTVQSLVRF